MTQHKGILVEINPLVMMTTKTMMMRRRRTTKRKEIMKERKTMKMTFMVMRQTNSKSSEGSPSRRAL